MVSHPTVLHAGGAQNRSAAADQRNGEAAAAAAIGLDFQSSANSGLSGPRRPREMADH